MSTNQSGNGLWNMTVGEREASLKALEEEIAKRGGNPREVFDRLRKDHSFAGRLADFALSGGITAATAVNFDSQLCDWQKFFKQVRGVDVKLDDLRKLRIPEAGPDFGWIVVMLKDDSPNKIFNGMSPKRMEIYKWYDDLDAGEHDRVADHAYIIRVRNRVEADKELKEHSANKLKELGIKGITLAEYLQLHDFYHWKTGNHFDKVNVTLCSGSRRPGGNVPYAYWNPSYGRVFVGAYHPGDADGDLRSREVVS